MTKKKGVPLRNKVLKHTKGSRNILRSAGFKVTRPPCAGEFMGGLYNLMSKDVDQSTMSEDWKDGAFNVMHQTHRIICNWCKCNGCKERAQQLMKFIVTEDEAQETKHEEGGVDQ